MPRTLTARTLREINLRESGEAYLLLVTISHPEIPGGELRIVNNTQVITSRGLDYEPRGFTWTLPEDTDDAAGELEFSFDNVDSETTDWLRQITDAPDVLIEVIGATDPDTVEISIEDLKLRGISIDVAKVSGKLAHEDVLNFRFPADSYAPEEWAGIF